MGCLSIITIRWPTRAEKMEIEHAVYLPHLCTKPIGISWAQIAEYFPEYFIHHTDQILL